MGYNIIVVFCSIDHLVSIKNSQRLQQTKIVNKKEFWNNIIQTNSNWCVLFHPDFISCIKRKKMIIFDYVLISC